MSLVALLCLAGCCLQVTEDLAFAGPPDAGRCSGVYCAAFYTCDDLDGTCRCGNLSCNTGNCDDQTGSCLPGCGMPSVCGADAGSGGALALMGVGCPGAGKAIKLPDAVVGARYLQRITAGCGNPPYTFANATLTPPSMLLAPNGDISGTPLKPGAEPFVFLVKVSDSSGHSAYENFVLNEVASR